MMKIEIMAYLDNGPFMFMTISILEMKWSILGWDTYSQKRIGGDELRYLIAINKDGKFYVKEK